MRIVAIESSCDETSAAIVEDGRVVLSNVIASSRDMFEKSGGVIPEEAARRQVECILPVMHQALTEARCDWKDIDAIAVTKGPGLLGSLLVGTVTARVAASVHEKKLIGVHHTLGHLSSTWLEAPADDLPVFPLLTLSVSGGHSDIRLRDSHTKGRLLGSTRDDAAGEAFDKGATLLGLPYPGGPAVAKLARDGDRRAFPFPMPLHKEDTLDFSFSGLKTALRYTLRDHPEAVIADVAASYETAICRHLTDRLERALQKHPKIRELHVVGGVSANATLRSMVADCAGGRVVRFPKTLAYCTDNAAMIASAGYFMTQELGDAAYEPFETEAMMML